MTPVPVYFPWWVPKRTFLAPCFDMIDVFVSQGTLRVLLVLLHDFPEFLCDYHFSFCDVIPPNCIQMRNLILSAFPRNMRLPDPFTPNLKVRCLLAFLLFSSSLFSSSPLSFSFFGLVVLIWERGKMMKIRTQHIVLFSGWSSYWHCSFTSYFNELRCSNPTSHLQKGTSII